MMVETYLRRGKRSLERIALDPRVRGAGAVIAYGGSGFLLSAANLGNYCQPLALGLICATTGWRTLVMTLGAMAGYPSFWGSSGNQGIVWSAAGGLLALLVGKKEESREQPLMIPSLCALLTAVTGLCFQFIVKEQTPLMVHLLRVILTFFCGVLFTQTARCRDAVTDWLAGGVVVFALAQVWLSNGFCLGYLAAGILAVGSSFPAAALAGLGLDLAQVTALPMAAVLCMAYFIGMVPFRKRWQHYLSPAIAWLVVSAACGIWDQRVLAGIGLGGALGALLTPRLAATRRRGETGLAQVRLELGASMLGTIQQMLLEVEPPPIDEEALLTNVHQHACATCPAGKNCVQRKNLTTFLLSHPLEADCRKQGRLVPELRRGNEKWKALKADRKRRQEYQLALVRQYRFLSTYLRNLADQLPRSARHREISFRVEVSARSVGKEGANGDRCLAFAGPECRYYVLLCDGMGTGVEAAREGASAANLLRKMLTAGFPAEYALQTLNDVYTLRDSAGAVTVDLAELHLDTGHAHLYKWGAAPSYVLTRSGAEKIGTATPPPGFSVDQKPGAVQKLSLRRGEVLMLLSDGVDGEVVQHLSVLSPDLPPGELAAKLLEKSGGGVEDDVTAAVIKLRPTNLPTS